MNHVHLSVEVEQNLGEDSTRRAAPCSKVKTDYVMSFKVISSLLSNFRSKVGSEVTISDLLSFWVLLTFIVGCLCVIFAGHFNVWGESYRAFGKLWII